jgi:hypothetical protein
VRVTNKGSCARISELRAIAPIIKDNDCTVGELMELTDLSRQRIQSLINNYKEWFVAKGPGNSPSWQLKDGILPVINQYLIAHKQLLTH